MSDLGRALASPETKAPYVRRLFDTIAGRYDLITILLSFGLDAHWKRRLAERAAIRPGMRALDLACGTGDIAFELRRRGARVTGLDITLRMLQLARQKPAALAGAVHFLQGDMTTLPFADASMDVVTTGYGIRNVPRIQPAIAEIHRVLRPGGLFLSLDFDRPSNGLMRAVYLGYLHLVGGALGWALHGDPDTYRYIPASIARYPGARALSAQLEAIGFETAARVPVLGGLLAMNIARR